MSQIPKPKICFIARTIYKILKPDVVNIPFGGLDVQLSITAKKLKGLGYPVEFVVFDYGQPKSEMIDGFLCLKIYREEKNINYLTPHSLKKIFLLWKALEAADADIYYIQGYNPLAFIVSIFCKVKKRKFVFAVASAYDVDPGHFFYKSTKLCERYPYFYGIKNADAIITQIEDQKTQLENNFRLKSIKIPNPIPLENQSIASGNREYIIWAGKNTFWKQPGLVIELAKKLPETKILILGISPLAKEIAGAPLNSLKDCPNIVCLGFVPYPKQLHYFEKASLLVHTSLFEGFPNVFLEAWSSGTPVVSLHFDPDECICRKKLGFHSRTFDNMVSQVKLLLANNELRREMGLNGRRYVEENHDLNIIINKYTSLLDSLYAQ
ncbi:MAG: glycosyltransferase family 4 protein [Candidatus Omnitrophica bacterium]|nr:glycosyltransferase family 4 protein [Candidatus Omnitrophota bacterium]